jgi:DNA-binding CsgD family transcriptional regulator/transcriptional regulator with XRE-family HTH domain
MAPRSSSSATTATTAARPFGVALKRARRAARLTQAQLAEQACFSVVYISMLERGARLPQRTTVILLADALDLSASERVALAQAAFATDGAQFQRGEADATTTALPLGDFLSPLPAGPLVGRERELQVLDTLLDGVTHRGAALVLHGAAGIGKSALLAASRARARAHGMRVLSISGVQAETQLPFAGLHQLLRPIMAHAGELSPPQRDALSAALGMHDRSDDSPAPMRFLIALATLELLAIAAEEQPVLVIADDAHWLDASSADALAFVARRLGSEPVVLLLAHREGMENALAPTGLPHLAVGRLEDTAAAALLDAHVPGLAPSVRLRLLEEAAGNPLALLELPLTLKAEQLGGAAPLPAQLPLTARLEQAFGERVARLPDVTRALLLVAALDMGDLAEALQAATLLLGERAPEEALEPASLAGLAQVDDLVIRFRHPLVRSAVCQAAGSARLRAAHAALATTLTTLNQPERAIWHRAAAVVGRDEQVAGELEALATAAAARGAAGVAVTALERAARLTNDPTKQVTRLLQAINIAHELDLDLARRLLRDVERLDLAPLQREAAMWLREDMAADGQWTGAELVRPFVELAERARLEGDTARALVYLWQISLRCFWSNPDTETRALVVSVAERLEAPDTHPQLLITLACVAPIERGAVVLERLSRLPTDGGDPTAAFVCGLAAVAVGAFDRAAKCLGPAIDALRMRGQLGIVSQALVAQALATRYTGNWQVATPAADEATRLAQEFGQARWGAAAQALGAAVDGLCGETARAEASASEAEGVIRAAQAHPMLALVQLARGAAALTAGRSDEAFERLWRVFDSSDIAYHPVVRCWAVADLVEAAIHSGHLEQAHAVAQEMESLARQSPFPVLLAGLHFARAVLAEDDAAEALFLAGLQADLTDHVLIRERLQLAYGAWLRRHRRIIESRTWMRTARDALDALGAVPWADRARQALQAAGESSQRRAPVERDRLTPQELQIAHLAADGLTNREIGQRLYLSQRTVGSHLHRLLLKLGIAKRSELQVALARGWLPS